MSWPKGQLVSPETLAKRAATLAATGRRHKKRNVDGTWRCPTCGRDLKPGEFHSKKKTPSGLSSQCRQCHGAANIRTRNPELHRAANRRNEATRRARFAGSTGTVSAGDYERLAAILGNACLCCQSEVAIQWDHIVPISRGGEHSPANLQPLCRSCNERKQASEADYRSVEQLASVRAVWVVEFTRVHDPSARTVAP